MSTKGTKLQLLEFDEEDQVTFTINESYANNYKKWRSKEEQQKLKDRYGEELDRESGDESESDSSTELESDDEDFFKTLSALRAKDPRIYDQKEEFFHPPVGTDAPKKIKPDKKPFLLKDHERETVLTGNALEADEDNSLSQKNDKAPISYAAEQNSIKKSFELATKLIDSDDDGDSYEMSDLLKKRQKQSAEAGVDEDADMRKWLKGKIQSLSSDTSKNSEKELRFLGDCWTNENLQEDEQFLRDFFVNKNYVSDMKDNEMLDEIEEATQTLSEDEEQVNAMELFEHKYNFRFEEPDEEFVKRYPRTIEDSLRLTRTKRKEERTKSKEKKQQIKERKLAEVQQYKALKRKELQERIEQLKEVGGDLEFMEADVNDDFDPEEHDRRMKELFNEDYYTTEEGGKPVFPYDESIDDYQVEEGIEIEDDDDVLGIKQEQHSDDEASHVSASTSKSSSTIKTNNLELNAQSKSKKKGKQDSKIPTFNAELHGSYENYIDEYFKHDFEDVIGDMPCRFKYRSVVPNDFGLTTEEILNADDTELNQWASLKKTYTYRTIEEETFDLKAFQKKAALSEKKEKVLKSCYQKESSEVSAQSAAGSSKPSKATSGTSQSKLINVPDNSSKSKKKKRKRKSKGGQPDGNNLNVSPSNTKSDTTQSKVVNGQDNLSKSKNKKRKHKSKKGWQSNGNNLEPAAGIQDDRLEAYGVNSKKFKRQLMYKNKNKKKA